MSQSLNAHVILHKLALALPVHNDASIKPLRLIQDHQNC